MPARYTRLGPNRSVSTPDTGNSTAITSAAIVTEIRTETLGRSSCVVA
ncbi:Uncharacterised protein [Mycobacteroides abscessus subsp. abscessus]|nr:Uncharacterised protein [Mycobacteroides abscessus subsp. abscessus]